MTPRERVLKILQGKQPDKVPWFGDLDYWASALIAKGEKPRDFKTSKEYIAWHRTLGAGFYLQGHFPFRQIIDNCEVKQWTDGNNRYRQVDTPHGKLKECWTYLPAAFTEGPTEHLIKSEKDLAAYRYMCENTRYEPDYDFAQKRLTDVEKMGIVLGYLPRSPFMHLVALDAGIEAVTMAYFNAQNEFIQTMEILEESHNKAAQIALDSPVEALMIPENLSSEIVGPTFFEMFMRKYQQHWAAKISSAGKFSFIHMDGTLKGLLAQECSTGIDVIEALTPMPVGDLEIEKWSEYAGKSKSILWGGIPGVYFTNLVSDEEFERHIRNVLAVMVTEPRYVLGVADQVPPDCIASRVKRVAEIVEDSGDYI